MPKLDITTQFRSALRSAAHALKPVVIIGDNGLTDGVLQEINTNLNAHSLIKVRVSGDSREDRLAIQASICDQLDCAPVHHLGKILTFYRSGKNDPFAKDWAKSISPHEDELLALAARKANQAHLPKKYAVAGFDEAPARSKKSKPEEPERANQSIRERYLGKDAPRPSLHKPKESSKKSRSSSGGSRTSSSRQGPRKFGSALSLRSGARRRST